jgi:hypothetical protein
LLDWFYRIDPQTFDDVKLFDGLLEMRPSKAAGIFVSLVQIL